MNEIRAIELSDGEEMVVEQAAARRVSEDPREQTIERRRRFIEPAPTPEAREWQPL